jgi:hypothetical protein
MPKLLGKAGRLTYFRQAVPARSLEPSQRDDYKHEEDWDNKLVLMKLSQGYAFLTTLGPRIRKVRLKSRTEIPGTPTPYCFAASSSASVQALIQCSPQPPQYTDDPLESNTKLAPL